MAKDDGAGGVDFAGKRIRKDSLDMTRLESVIDIQAPREQVWEILVDVEAWPEWTPTVLSVRRGDPGALSVGSRTHIRQPKLLPAWWEVTELAAPRSFTWISRSPGVRVTAGHIIEAVDSGSRLTLSLEFSGSLSFLLVPLMRWLSQSYIATEAQKLKERSEQGRRHIPTIQHADPAR